MAKLLRRLKKLESGSVQSKATAGVMVTLTSDRCRGTCNCSFCRRKKGLAPTGILIHEAEKKGFSCVKDYLEARSKVEFY
jgi:hypothetical protein